MVALGGVLYCQYRSFPGSLLVARRGYLVAGWVWWVVPSKFLQRPRYHHTPRRRLYSFPATDSADSLKFASNVVCGRIEVRHQLFQVPVPDHLRQFENIQLVVAVMLGDKGVGFVKIDWRHTHCSVIGHLLRSERWTTRAIHQSLYFMVVP